MLTTPYPEERRPSSETTSATGRDRPSDSIPVELPSEQLGGWLPRVLNTKDMTVLCLFSVLLVSNVQLIAGAGGSAYIYWWLGFLFFLIPSALTCGQLYRLFPGEGAVYLWANKAFGSFWDTFLGLFCNWFPGAIGLTIEAGAVVTSVQALNANWLAVPWQQGLVEILVLVVAQGLCQLGQRRLMSILTWVFLAYISMIVLLGLAGLVWIASGHAVQGDFSAHGWQVSTANYPVFATVIVSLLGMAVPLNLGAEVMNQRSGGHYLRWGVIITVVGYLVATFGVLAVLPPKDITNPAFVAEIFSLSFGPVVGTFLGVLNDLILVAYFVCATAAFNLIFARLLLVAGADRRLPRAMQRLSRQRVPANAMLTQTILNVVFVAILFFVVPAFAPANQGLSFVVFLVTINGASVIWNIAMIGLFLCGILLFVRYKRQLIGRWIAPPIVLFLAAGLGIFSSAVAIYSTFFAGSPVPQALGNGDWDYYVLLVVLGSLAVGAAYSFLVPEVEDLMALANIERPERPRQRSGNEGRQDTQREDSYAQHHLAPPPTPRTADISGNVSAPQNQPVPGELFARTTRRAGPYSNRDIPGRMG
ncbi:MAG: hypothetical protein NVS4B11_13050 [Ktedonobacteraceae bacterium]